MKRLRFPLLCSYLLLALLVGGCMDLAVQNLDQPERERAVSTPQDVESLISGSFLTWWSGTQKDANYPALTLSTMADAHTSSWGNWGMQDLSSEPRVAFDNSPSYRYGGVCADTWYAMYRALSAVNDGLAAINKGMKITEAGKDVTARAQAFGKFVQGISHAWLACFFDKAFIYDETIDVNTQKLEFKPHGEVMTAALKMLEDCIAISNANTFKIPNTWINGVELTNVQLKELAYSYMARYRAAVARNAAERAAVNWAKVISDAQSGIKADFAPIGDGVNWWDGLKFRGMHATWTRADYKTIGISDTSGRYQTWLNTPVASRSPFDVATADRRITAAGGPKTSGTDFRYSSPSPFRDDRGTYHHSFYVPSRYRYHVDQGATGLMTTLMVAEMDLTIAEGLMRTGGSKQTVCDLINKTRVTRGQLPPVTTSLSDADLTKWLRYEKMVETFATAGGLPWFDRRGWGELVSGTLISWPVPGKELEVLQLQIYTFGGIGGAGAAPKRDVNSRAPLHLVRPE